jgi:hypothetical protein
MLRYFFDTEFMEDGSTIELVSIGMVSEDGRSELYCVNGEANFSKASPWVRTHVLRHLPKMADRAWKTKAEIRRAVLEFMYGGTQPPRPALELWAYYASYDWVVFCQLFGTMMDVPPALPEHCMAVKQYAVMLGSPKLPLVDQSTVHNALVDARWTREAWLVLQAEARRRRETEFTHGEVLGAG